ncbi:MAG: hypothetical protein NTNFB02_36690 [Nitrospira sp.]
MYRHLHAVLGAGRHMKVTQMDTTPIDVTVKLEEPVSAQERVVEALAQDGHEGQRRSHAQDGDGDGMDRRGAERAPVDCPVSFTSEEIHGSVAQLDGTLVDLSKTGCQVASLTPPYRGSQITLVLYLRDGGPPLRLIGTTVRHVGCRTFGAEFLSVTPEERRRLQIIIFKHLTWSVFSLRRPAFRFA